MSRYYADLDDTYYVSRQPSNSVRASGWQSPIPPTNDLTLSSAILRISVDCPFGSKKCEYTIDKSQRGCLIVSARRRRHTFSSDQLSNPVIQTFTVPLDADVDRLQSHIDRSTNCLIIEIPRAQSLYTNTRNIYTNSIRSPDILPLPTDISYLPHTNQTYSRNNEKFEYRVDCRGYQADELDVFIQGRDLIVQGKTNQPISTDPTRSNTSKHFSRKIPLPSNVDLSTVISYFENGELRIEAALKRRMYPYNEFVYLPEATRITAPNQTASQMVRMQSPIPSGGRQRHYRRREHVNRRRAYDQGDDRRARSVDNLLYPIYTSAQDFADQTNRRSRSVKYARYTTNRNQLDQQPIYRTAYSPINDSVTTYSR